MTSHTSRADAGQRIVQTVFARLCLLLTLLLVFPAIAGADDVYFQNVNGGLYSTGGNWSGGNPPDSDDRAIFDLQFEDIVVDFTDVLNQSNGFSIINSTSVTFRDVAVGARYDAGFGGPSTVAGSSSLEISGENDLQVYVHSLSIQEQGNVSVQGELLLFPYAASFGNFSPTLTLGSDGSNSVLTVIGNGRLHSFSFPDVPVQHYFGSNSGVLIGGSNASVSLDDTLIAAGNIQVVGGSRLTLENLELMGLIEANTNALVEVDEELEIYFGGGMSISNGANLNSNGTLWVHDGGSLNVGNGGSDPSSLFANDILVENGNVTIGSNGGLSQSFLAEGTPSITIRNAGQMTLQSWQSFRHNTLVTGSGSLLETSASNFSVQAELTVTDGATAQIEGMFYLGDFFSQGTATISTQGELNAAGVEYGGYGENRLTVDNAKLDVFGALNVTPQLNDAMAVLDIANGSQVTAGVMIIGGNDFVTSTAKVTVNDSSVEINSGSPLIVGAPANTTGLLDIRSGSFTTDMTILDVTGTIRVAGGQVDLGLVTDVGGKIDYQGGNLAFTADVIIGGDFLFGEDVLELGDEQELQVQGIVTVDPNAALIIDKGQLSTLSLNVGGQADIKSGALLLEQDLTIGATFGPAALVRVGTTGPTFVGLNGNLLVTASSQLQVSGGRVNSNNVTNDGILTIQGGATETGFLVNGAQANMIVSGGSVTTFGDLINVGNLTATAGQILTHNELSNQPGALIHVGGTATVFVGNTLDNLGDLLLDGPAVSVTGGPLDNRGLIRGTGKILNPLANFPNGEIRAENGKTLQFLGINAPNMGRINLQGGTLEFGQPIENGPGGQITGRGSLFAHNGLINQGQLHFSGGFTDLHGNIVNSPGGEIIVSGGSVTTIFDDLNHNGDTIRLRDNTTLVIFGHLSGAGGFSGNGLLAIEGTQSPGNSPALVSLDLDYALSSSAELIMELGGRQLGAQYDSLLITGSAELDGLLDVRLIDDFSPLAGDQFQLLLASGGVIGTFDQLLLPPLPAHLGWNVTYSAQSVTLDVQTVPEPSTWLLGMLALVGFAAAARRRGRQG